MIKLHHLQLKSVSMAIFFATIYSGQNRGVGYKKGTIYGVVFGAIGAMGAKVLVD